MRGLPPALVASTIATRQEGLCLPQSTLYEQAVTLNETAHPWLAFHNVMRGFRYSLQHGNPYLLNQNDLRFWRVWWYDSLALPVGGRLLLRERRYAKISTIGKWSAGYDEVYRMCPHTHTSGLTRRVFDRELNRATEVLASLGDNESLQGFVFKTYKCTQCPTEFSIEVQPLTFFQGRVTEEMVCEEHVILVTSYKDLGACQSPDEMEWRALSTWHRRPQDSRWWLPSFAKQKTTDSSVKWPAIDVTHMEAISTRFERQLMSRPPISACPDDMITLLSDHRMSVQGVD